MFNKEEPTVLPERTPAKPLYTEKAAREQAYYGSYFANKKYIEQAKGVLAARQNALDTYNKIHTDLTTIGESPLLETIKSDLSLQDTQKQKEDVLAIASNPDIPVEQRANVLQNTKAFKFNFADKYREQIAAEDKSITKKDFQVQEKNIQHFQDRYKQAREDVRRLQNTAIGNIDVTHAGFAASAVLQLAPGRSGTLYANAYDALLGKPTSLSTVGNAALYGSTTRDMGKLYASMNPQQKKEATMRLVDYLKNSTALDADKLDILLHTFDNPEQPWWETSLGNIGGILEAFLVGSIAKAPFTSAKAFAKWAINWDVAKDRAFVNKVSTFLTGKGVFKADVVVKGTQEVANQSAAIQATSRQELSPISPLGAEATHNPDVAANTAISAILDDSKTIAKAVTGEEEGVGQVIQSTILPKPLSIDETVGNTYPNIAEKVIAAAKALRPNTEVNPALYDEAFQKSEINTVMEIIKQESIPSLHLNKTLVDFKFGDTTNIKAVYGQSDTHGWLDAKEAQLALEKLTKEAPELAKAFKVEYSSKNQEYFIIRDVEKPFNPNVLMEDTSATFQIPYTKKLINIDAIARSKYINWFMPASSRITQGLHSSVMATEMGVAQRVADLNKYLNTFIMNKTDVFPDLHKELSAIQKQEVTKWKNVEELLADKHHLSKQQKEDLVESYYATKALGDNLYEIANKRHRREKAEQGKKAIYMEDGSVHGYGLEVKPNADTPVMVWDLDNNVPIILKKDEKGDVMLAGRSLVKLDAPIKEQWAKVAPAFKNAEDAKVAHNVLNKETADNRFEYAILGSKAKVGELPEYTLNKIDPYIPWYHTADFFIQRTPKQIRVNGSITSDTSQLTERIAGARTEAEANQLMKQLAAEDPEGTFQVVKRREDVINDVIDIHEEAKKTASWEKHRGTPLKGHDPLDDPIRSLAHMGKSLMQLDAWEDVKRFFDKRMLEEYGDILPQGQIPKSPDNWKLLDKKSTPENIARIAAAKREMEWFNGVFRSMVESDRAVSATMHTMADVLNKYGTTDSKLLRGAEKATRDAAKQGNLFIRLPNAAATHLLLYSNILKQWVVQPQNLWTLHALDIGFAKYGTPNILPFLFSILGESKYFKNNAAEFKAISKHIGGTISGIKGKEWDDMYEGFVKSGMLQAVDLNQMVLGLKHHDNYTLAPEVHEQIARGLSQTISAPGNLMKMVGYTPAELSNLVGGWLYSYNQYKKLHPGVDMTNPHVIEQVKAKALALTGSMAGNSDVMSYQKGMWTLLFKFMPIQSKQLALMTTSKYTTKEEKLRMAVGQTVLWGVPGTLGGVAIMDIVKNNVSEEEKTIIQKYEGGIVDLTLNNLLDVTIRHAFGVDDEKETSLGFSATMAPFNNGYGVPAIEIFHNVWKTFSDGEEAGHTRIAALGTYSILKDMYNAINNRLIVREAYDTPDATQILVEELPNLAKGWDNLEKGYLMMQAGKLVSKHGNPRQLVASHGDAFGRMFGVYTREELAAFKNINVEKGKRAAQKQIEKEIFNFIMSNKQDLLGMDKQSRSFELDKLLHVLGHDDPELMQKIKTSLEKKIFFANKDLADNINAQLEFGMNGSRQQVENALKDAPEGGSLQEFLNTLLNRNKE